jgi:hypothetical protein
MHGTAVNPDTGGIAEYKELSTCSNGNLWQPSNADEIGRIFHGLGPDSYMPTGTNTLFFIDKKDVSKDKKPIYVRVVCADRPENANPKRVRWTAGGDKVEYHLKTLLHWFAHNYITEFDGIVLWCQYYFLHIIFPKKNAGDTCVI